MRILGVERKRDGRLNRKRNEDEKIKGRKPGAKEAEGVTTRQ